MTPYERNYEFTVTDLIDQMTIDQIKEVLLPSSARKGYGRSLELLSADVTALWEARSLKLTGRVLRLLVLLAQLNLETWRCKDRLDEAPEEYTATLRHAQDLNGLRNCVRNLLQVVLGEASPSRQRASFFVTDDGLEYRRRIMSDLERDARPEPQGIGR